MVESGVGCRMAQCSTHCYDLALVMKGMGQDLVKDERRRADGDISIREIKLVSLLSCRSVNPDK